MHKLINIKYVPNYIYYILWVFQYFSAEKERIKEKKKDGKWKKKDFKKFKSGSAWNQFPWARVNFGHMTASLCTYHNWLWTFMLPCGIATFDKLNNFYSFLIFVHFYRDFAQFGHVVSLGHYVMGSEEILKLEEYIKMYKYF